jgi:hypothetical protein
LNASCHCGLSGFTGPSGAQDIPLTSIHSAPPMPTRFIASRSAVMPSLLMLPLIQNQKTQGRAEGGGAAKFFAKSSAGILKVASVQSASSVSNRFFMVSSPVVVVEMERGNWFMVFLTTWRFYSVVVKKSRRTAS